MQKKHSWLDRAEVIDSLRVFPRLFLLSCFLWAVWVGQQLLTWYMALPGIERGLEATGFASIVFLGIMTFLKMVYTDYSTTGRSWGPPTPITRESTVVASKVTETAGAGSGS